MKLLAAALFASANAYSVKLNLIDMVGGLFGSPPVAELPEDAPVAAADEFPTYEDWMRKFVKEPTFTPHSKLAEWRNSLEFYNTDREAIYNQNLQTIVEHNMKNDIGESGFRMGVNEYTDLTYEEFRRVLGLGGCLMNRTAEADVAEILTPAADTVDWRKQGAVTAVKNQEQCGSCWAFSTTGSTEGAVKIATGTLTSLSEQQLVDCSKAEGNNGCQGGLMDYGFKYIIKNGGLDTEADYRYTAKNGVCNTAKAAKHVSSIKSFADVASDNEAELAKAVTQQPVSVAIEADQTAFQHYKSGVFDSTCGTKLDHGVLAVGYTSEAWIVKNSWGATWGDEGYIMMKRGVSRKGICGIAMQPSYPIAGAGPGPSPPSPGPTPGPGGDYEDPYRVKECNAGEVNATLSGVDGASCLPECTGPLHRECPEAPAGFHAEAQCVVEDQSSGKKYCALICDPDRFFSCDKRMESTCKSVQNTGICTYNS